MLDKNKKRCWIKLLMLDAGSFPKELVMIEGFKGRFRPE